MSRLTEKGRRAVQECLTFDRASPLSIYERQCILSTTEDGRMAGCLPVGHRDDSASSRFAGWVEPGEEEGVIRLHPDEALTPAEEAVAVRIARGDTCEATARALGYVRIDDQGRERPLKMRVWRIWDRAKEKLARRARRLQRAYEG